LYSSYSNNVMMGTENSFLIVLIPIQLLLIIVAVLKKISLF